jgi:hypothetical protein
MTTAPVFHVPAPAGPVRPATPATHARTPAKPTRRELVAALAGPRHVAGVTIDAVGAGMIRPFLLVVAVRVLGLDVARAGLALTVGSVVALAAVPWCGRWIDRGARTGTVAATMAARGVGVAVLALPVGHGSPTALAAFLVATALTGVGGACFPPAQAALVAGVARPEHRDAALAFTRSVRNAGLGVGALAAGVVAAGGPAAMRATTVAAVAVFAVAATLVATGRPRLVTPRPPTTAAPSVRTRHGRPTVLDLTNVPYAFTFNVLEVALPAVIVTRLHAAPVWSSAVFVGNTVIVVLAQVAVVTWARRFPRRVVLAAAGGLLAATYLAFWAAGGLGGNLGAAAIALVGVPYTLGEILYTGTGEALVVASTPPDRLGAALARYQLAGGLGSAVSPAVLMAALALGPAALWGGLALVTAGSGLLVLRRGPRA